MNQETIKAAKKFASSRLFPEASEFAFIAGAEHRDSKCEEAIRVAVEFAVNEKQQQIDELVDWVIILKEVIEELDDEFNNPDLNKLIQKHKR
jgi:hypothetical protein